MRRERRRERLDPLGLDRQPRGGAVAAEAQQMAGARAEPGVQVERRHRPARPLPLAVGAGDDHDRPVVALDEPRGDDADHAFVPTLARDDVAAPAAARLGPRLDLVDRLARDPLLDGLPLAVQRLELLGERPGLVGVLGQQQRERSLGPAEPPRCVDARREPEADRRLVDRRGIDAADPHERAQADLLRLREAAQAEQRERAVLVDERHDVRDRGQRDDVEVALQERMVGAEQRLGELPDDAGAAEAREGIVALQRRDDGTGGERLGGAMVIGDDDLEPERARVLDLGNRGDPAVDRQDEVEALLGEPRQRLAVQAVPLLEPRGEMPGDVGVKLAQQQHGERRRADAVGVVVAVHADARTGLDRGDDRLDRLTHVAEGEGIVARQRALEEPARLGLVAEPAADEHRRGHVVDLERGRKRPHIGVRARREFPGAGCHRAVEGTATVGRIPRKVLEKLL